MFLHKYLRDENRNPFGVALATKTEDGQIVFGISKCNRSKGDIFQKGKGVTIALGRATNPRTSLNSTFIESLANWEHYARKRLEKGK